MKFRPIETDRPEFRDLQRREEANPPPSGDGFTFFAFRLQPKSRMPVTASAGGKSPCIARLVRDLQTRQLKAGLLPGAGLEAFIGIEVAQ